MKQQQQLLQSRGEREQKAFALGKSSPDLILQILTRRPLWKFFFFPANKLRRSEICLFHPHLTCLTLYRKSHLNNQSYKSLILPHLDYCSAVWGCIGNGQKLEKLQNGAARIITGSGWDVRSAQILFALKWESLADRRSKQLKSLMFKTANNLVPEYLSDKFTSVNTIHRQSSGRLT